MRRWMQHDNDTGEGAAVD